MGDTLSRNMDISEALKILGLASNPSRSDIKKAYREQVKLWHPDRYSNGSTMKKMAQKNIQDANLAYAFLQRHLPAASKNVSPHPSRTIHHAQTPPRSYAFHRLIDGGLRLLAALSQRFPRIQFQPVLEWLQDDARNHYRPWYRYPAPSDAEQKRRTNLRFDQALKEAMGNRSPTNHIHGRRRSPPQKNRENTVTPIKGVSKSVESNRT